MVNPHQLNLYGPIGAVNLSYGFEDRRWPLIDTVPQARGLHRADGVRRPLVGDQIIGAWT